MPGHCSYAARLQTSLRDTDTLVRLGGDEFALLLPSTSPDEARAVAERLLRGFVAPFEVGSASLELGISIGIAIHPDHGSDSDTLLRRADQAMYLAKADRSGWAMYQPERDNYSPDRLALVADLRHAIAHDEPSCTTNRRLTSAPADSWPSKRSCAGRILNADYSLRIPSSRSPNKRS